MTVHSRRELLRCAVGALALGLGAQAASWAEERRLPPVSIFKEPT